MTTNDFLDVTTPNVIQAGRQTAGTAEGWYSWGDRAKTVFETTETQLRSELIVSAMGEYAGGTVQRATRVGTQVHNAGVNTTSAATVVENVDVDQSGQLHLQGGNAAEQASLLSRPVNGTAVAI